MTYKQLKEKHSKEVHNFPMAFAFDQYQFEAGMKKLGLHPSQTDQIINIGGGGFIRTKDSIAWNQMLHKHDLEMKQAIQQDRTGDGFIYQMFIAELANHEYTYSGDITDALRALGLTYEQVMSDQRLSHGLKKACDKLMYGC